MQIYSDWCFAKPNESKTTSFEAFCILSLFGLNGFYYFPRLTLNLPCVVISKLLHIFWPYLPIFQAYISAPPYCQRALDFSVPINLNLHQMNMYTFHTYTCRPHINLYQPPIDASIRYPKAFAVDPFYSLLCSYVSQLSLLHAYFSKLV